MPTKIKPKKINFIILLILLVGTLLRAYNLSSESISFDEAVTIGLTKYPNLDYGNPHFYYIFLNYWIGLFGNSEFAIRLTSVIFGVLSILVLYHLANLLFGENIALLSALILAVNPFHIFYSQEARMYSLFVLFSLLSLLYLFKVLKETRKIKNFSGVNKALLTKKRTNWFFYILFNLLNLYTHYFAVFVLLVEVLYFVLFYKNFKFKLKYFILTNFVVLVLFSPQFIKIYNGLLSKTSEFNWGIKPSEYFISIFNSFLGWNILFAMVVFLLFLFGLLKIDNKKTNLFGLIYVLFPVIVGFFLSFKMAIMPRYFIFILPVYIMFISKGLINIKYKLAQILLISGILVISGFKLVEDYSNLDNPRWSEVAAYIERNSQKNDIILFDNGYTNFLFDYYYKGNLTSIGLLSSTNVTENEIFYNNIKPNLKASGVWLILSDDFRSDKYYKYRLGYDFKLISSKQFVGIGVYLYSKG